MRILRLMGYPIRNCASLERIILAQGRELIRRGHHFELGFDGVANEESLAAAARFAPEVTIRTDFPEVLGRGLRARRAYARYLHEVIETGGYDIVHCYFLPGAAVLNDIAPNLGRARCIRTVGTVPRLSASSSLVASLQGLRMRRWLSNMAKIICVSEAVQRRLVDFGIDARRLVVIHNATDTEHFKAGNGPGRGQEFRLTYTGRLEHVKEIDVLVRGVAELVQRRGMRDVRLNIVGQGSQRPALEALARALGVGAYVRFHGYRSDIPRILAEECDAYVTASCSEGLPCSVLEAMSCELPLVASDIDEHREVVVDGENGCLFRVHDPVAFADAVERLRTSLDLRQVGRRNRQKVVERFGLATWIERELAVYESVIEGGGERREMRGTAR